MQPSHLNTLEYPKILDRLATYAMFSASKSLALSLSPSPFLSEVRARQEETSEADHILSVKPELTIGGSRDVRPMLDRTKRGAVLTPLELQEIRQTLIAARDLKRTITRLAKDYPRLADIAARIEECPGLVNEVGQAIDERGEVKSSASPALGRIRRDLDTAHHRLMEKLKRLIASTQNKNYLQEAIVTQREGRYVVPLKAEFKGKIRGVIHDQSASGATVFIEPLVTVELNNRWRQLQLDEENEIRKILAALSDMVSQQARYIEHTVVALADLDLAFAKAKYAQAIGATTPTLIDRTDRTLATRSITYLDARHPLLDPKTVVPINIVLDEETRMLMITGPNTGGKTVSLKTVGLLAIMAQAGLRIPAAEGSALPVFNHILADIGDEQSIEQSLSTFSGHMTNIVRILAQCDENSLVIFDELGAGTDPIEGSALARSILTNLLERRVTTFVATHYSDLKAFAHTTPGVTNASMEFDLESLAPTYRLLVGLPGASNAFAIAQRLGLPQNIINQARGMVGEDAQQVETMLAQIRSQIEAADQARHLAEQERDEAIAATERLNRRLADIDTERQEILNSARADARREIKAVRQKLRDLQAEAERLSEQQQPSIAQAQAAGPDRPDAEPATLEMIEAQLETVEADVEARAVPRPASLPTPSVNRRVQPGDQVYIDHYSTVGEVVSVQRGQVEVQLGHFRATVPLGEVELRKKRKSKSAEPPGSRVRTPPAESPGLELDLRGQVSEDAVMHLDQYLDQAYMAQLPWVRIIHGKGSGTLRQIVRQALSGHPMVSSYRAGGSGEGGEGVTVAQLAVSD